MTMSAAQLATSHSLGRVGRASLIVAGAVFAAVFFVALGSAWAAATFAPATTHNVGNNPQSVAIGDLDGDGKPDLATADSNADTVSVLLRKSDNTGFEGRNPPPGRRRPAYGGDR